MLSQSRDAAKMMVIKACTWVWGGEWGSYLELLLFPPLRWQVIQPVTALVNHLLGFAQPVLQWLCTDFKILHLDFEILPDRVRDGSLN